MNSVVTVTVSGPVGCGKSSIAGEIEIALKAIGVPVQYQDSASAKSEKNMTGADWQAYLEMYKPMVTIAERIDLNIDPTSRCDAIADKVRIWYEANRETWWQRHRPQVFSYRDNSGVVADEFMLGLINAVREAEKNSPHKNG